MAAPQTPLGRRVTRRPNRYLNEVTPERVGGGARRRSPQLVGGVVIRGGGRGRGRGRYQPVVELGNQDGDDNNNDCDENNNDDDENNNDDDKNNNDDGENNNDDGEDGGDGQEGEEVEDKEGDGDAATEEGQAARVDLLAVGQAVAAPEDLGAPPQQGGEGGHQLVGLELLLDPVIPGPAERSEGHADGWDRIDEVGAWECNLSVFSVLEFVPRQHQEVWGWAYREVLRRMQGPEGRELDRSLKWLQILPQLLLRSPRRHGSGGRVDVAKRFNCLSLRQDWGAALNYWMKDRLKLKEDKARDTVRNELTEAEKREKKKKQVISLLSKTQISRAVSRINSYGAAPLDEPGVKEQVAAKYPVRKKVIPFNIPRGSPIDNLGGLRENLLGLIKGSSPGTGALRPEFLKTLAGSLNPGQRSLLEDFGMRHLRGE